VVAIICESAISSTIGAAHPAPQSGSGGERSFVPDTRKVHILLTLASILLLSSGNLAAGTRQSVPQRRTLIEADANGLKQAIAKQKGKVVFVNMWATWCAPCVAEFPDVVKLYQKYRAKGLEVIAVSFDAEAALAIPFLDRQKADFINVWKTQKQDDDTFKRILEKEWLEKSAGALPASWLFDRSGKRQYFRVGKFDPSALDAQIAELLAGK
jgi:thiol-disulfide isomerase/thioredoxin